MLRRTRLLVISFLVLASITLGGLLLSRLLIVSEEQREKIVNALNTATKGCGDEYSLRVAVLVLRDKNLNQYIRRCHISVDQIRSQADIVMTNPDVFIFRPAFSEEYYAIHQNYFEKSCANPTVYCRLKTLLSDTFYDVRLRTSGDSTYPSTTKSYGNSF